MDQSVIDPMNDTALLEESSWEPDVRKNLLSELSTPQKAATELVPGQDHMKVFLRVRPFTSPEEEHKESQGCIDVLSDTSMVAKAPKDSNTFKNSQHGCAKQTHRFTFSKIFGADCSQKNFFDDTVLGIVKDFIDGQNCLIFTYGVTNSGKTYTIQGNPMDGGILPRALDVVFNSILDRYSDDVSLKPRMFGDVVRLTPSQVEREQAVKDKVFKMACNDEPDMTMLLGDCDMSRMTVNSTMSEDSLMMPAPRSRATSSIGEKRDSAATEDSEFASAVMAEVENRVREEAAVSIASQAQMRFSVWVSFVEVYNEQIFDLLEPLPKKKGAKRGVLQLREDKNGVPYVKGTKEIHVTNADEAYKVLTIGRQNLQFADTKLNHNSSRSHCIFTVKILRTVDVNAPHVARVSQLSFCDLAGAERSSKTMSQGDRMKEAGNINTSLLSLGRCIKVLRHNQMHRDHTQIVPFRDSKLTRLFQSFFCGKGKAAMIVNVNQCASMFDETLHALKYSAIAKQVVVVQEAPKEKPKLPGVRSHRFVSLALQDKGSRATMGWATPGTLARLNELEQQAVNVPIPDEDDEVFGNYDEREQELLDIIEQMKHELIEEKKKAHSMEMRIRAEVCDEMAKQIVEIENNYSSMMKEEKILAEERMEKRIEIYMHSVKKSNKRKRIFEEEVEENVETVPSVYYLEEQAKVKELNQRVSDMEAELNDAKEQLNNIVKERDALQQQHTEISFQMASLRTSQGAGDEGDLAHAHGEVVSRLQTQIKALRQELQDKDKENGELNEMITEAGETFEGNEAKIEELQNILSDYEARFKLQEDSVLELQKVAEESRKAMEDANSRLLAKHSAISDMQAQLEAKQECAECQMAVVRQADLVGKLADTETDLERRIHECERLRAELTSRDQVTAGLEEDIKRSRLSLDRRALEVTSLRDLMAQGQGSEQSKISKLTEQLEAAEEREKQSASTLADQKTKLEKYTTTMEEYKVALADHEGFVAELNKLIHEKSEKLVAREEELSGAMETANKLRLEVERTTKQLEELKGMIAEKSRQSTTASEKVSLLEQTLAAANEALREKSLEVNQLQQELVAAQEGRSAVKSAQELTATLRSDLERLQEQLKAHEECEATINHLQEQLDDYIFRVNEQAVQLGDLEDAAKADTSSKQLAELQQKISDLDSRLAGERNQAKSAQAERDALLQDKAVEIEQLNTKVWDLTKETERLTDAADKASAAKLELEKLKVQVSELNSRPAADMAEASTASDADNASLRTRVRELENVANEAEYKAQMGTRQLRREKSVLERRLKEVEAELEEAYQRCKGLEERIRDLRQIQVPVTKQDEEEKDAELEAKCAELEHKCVELESELSRHQGELAPLQQQAQEAQEQLELYKEKCLSLESAASQPDSQLAAREAQQATEKLSEALAQVESLQAQLAALQRSQDEEQQSAGELSQTLAQVESLQAQLAALQRSQDEEQQSAGELSEALAQVENLQAQLAALQRSQDEEKQAAGELAAITEQHEALQKEVTTLQQEIEDLQEAKLGLNKKLCDAEENLTRCTHTMELLETNGSTLKEQLAARQEELDGVRTQLVDQQSLVSKSQVEVSKLQASLECKLADVIRLEERLSAMEKESGKSSEQCIGLRTEAEELRAAKTELETQTRELQSKLDASHSNISDQETIVKKLEASLEEKECQLRNVHDQLVQLDKVQERVSELEAQLETAQKGLRDLRKEQKETTDHLHNREASIESYSKQLELRKEEVIILNQQVAKLSGSESALRDTLTALRSELETKDTRLGRMEDELEKKTNVAGEQKAMQDELEKSIERETKLRRQLQEASQRLEEQNVRVNIAEDKLKVSEEMADKYQKEIKNIRQEVDSLKEELNTTRQQTLEARDHERTHKDAVSSKEVELSRLSEELERKETRLKQRNATVKDLMAQMEQERASYEIALKDAKKNERMIESLKAAMDEQEATMETQDKVLQSREEHIQQMQADHEQQVSRYEAMMSSNRDHSSQMKEIQTRCRELQAKLDSAANAKLKDRDTMDETHRELEIKVREHRRRAERAEHERNRFEQDMKDTNGELRALERKLKEREAELSSLQAHQSQLEAATVKAEEAVRTSGDNDNKLAMLKIKFQKLEEHNKELEKINTERQQQLEEFSSKKKLEMEKWREDRDALVGQLQKILKEKDAKLATLTKSGTVVKSEEPLLEAEVAQLKQQVADKDETIAELSKHLDEGNTTRPRRAGRSRLGSDTSDILRKEVENIYRQLETERTGHREELNRALRAKDEIITDLKYSNQELLTNLSGGSNMHSVDVKVESHPPGAPSHEGGEEKSHRRRTTKGAGRKRKTSEAESENSMPDDTPRSKRSSQASSKGRKSKRAAQMQVSFNETDANFMAIQEEDMVDLDQQQLTTPSNSRVKRTALADTLNTSGNGDLERGPTFISPEKPSTSRKKKHRLRSTNPEQFAQSPAIDNENMNCRTDVHKTVTRSLRSRKKTSQV